MKALVSGVSSDATARERGGGRGGGGRVRGGGGEPALQRPTPGYLSHTAITREQSRPDK